MVLKILLGLALRTASSSVLTVRLNIEDWVFMLLSFVQHSLIPTGHGNSYGPCKSEGMLQLYVSELNVFDSESAFVTFQTVALLVIVIKWNVALCAGCVLPSAWLYHKRCTAEVSQSGSQHVQGESSWFGAQGSPATRNSGT